MPLFASLINVFVSSSIMVATAPPRVAASVNAAAAVKVVLD